ncbi:hypothetical protein NAT51_04585 [Flavobacterium amniphilum]|uniref:tetratricopeptide repeat protein n=1 Tax=Flavobacterium amniphilum TaxID=1834035 RepID=UPI00202A9F47|nr:hypothetical protein [Flavobacterium amniphilum]MCL9804784.1 hypothetical protein [Flavobacterium amniphilum]
MKNIFITLGLLLTVTAFSQKKDKNEDRILFERALALQEFADYDLRDRRNPDDTISLTTEERIEKDLTKEIREKILSKAIDGYEELIKDYPKSKLIFRALNNKGYAELQSDDTEKAKETFLKVLNSGANDKEKGGIGSGIMAEPYANYKNRACKILAEIEVENKNYQEALHYLDQTKKYPYRHFCGNEHAENDLYMTRMYSKCYLALNDYEKAYDVLLPNIIENGLASNHYIVELALDALVKKYTKDELKVQFENAFQNIITEKETRNKDEYNYYYIRFLNRKILLNSWDFYGGFASEEEMKKAANKILTESGFYKLLTK